MNASILSVFLKKFGVVVPTNGAGPVPLTAARALTDADNGAKLVYNGTTPITVTIAKDLAAGFGASIVQANTGVVTVAAASGVTLTSLSDYVKTAGQDAKIDLTNTSANKYILTGEGAVAA